MTTAVAGPVQLPLDGSGATLRLRCPECGGEAALLGSGDETSREDTLRCQSCLVKIRKTSGVWRMLTVEQQSRFACFLEGYEYLRREQGRASDDPAFYLALPFADLMGNFSDEWRMRARSFRYLEREILPRLTNLLRPSLRILDLGAGSGWLSYRLALAGHRPVAVDIYANAFDGLEAADVFAAVLEECFPRFQADMDRLPFEDRQFDVAIFNASLHFSTTCARTIREAIRCVRSGGSVVIMDSPANCSAAAEEHERDKCFSSGFAGAGRTPPSRHSLTHSDFEELSMLGVRWTRHLPLFGVRRRLHPWNARISGRAEAKQFYIYEGRLEAL